MESEIANSALDRLAQAVSLPTSPITHDFPLARQSPKPKQHIRWKFQTIFKKVGNLQEAIAWMDDMHAYGATPSTVKPSEAVFQGWAEQVESGEAEIPPKLEQSIGEMLDKRPQWLIHDLNRANIAAAKVMAEKVVAGESVTPVLLGYTNNAIGSNAAAITALRNGEKRPGDTFNFNGKTSFVAPPKPARLQTQRGAKQGENRKRGAIDAEFREVP